MQSILLTTLTEFSSDVPDSEYVYQTAVWHEFVNATNQYVLWGEDNFGSGSEWRLESVANIGGNPVSFVDNNYPTMEITLEQSNLLATHSINKDTESILDWLENNYFYHNSSPATSSVEIIDDINHWLTSGSLCSTLGAVIIETKPSYE